jgi:hypothetical protein
MHIKRYSILLILLSITMIANAGVVNPNISAIGQVFGTYTGEKFKNGEKDFSLGEAELVLDSPLNPYLNGMFVLSLDPESGVEIEEAYATLIKGLPWNFAMKAGKYRLNFGKLNSMHPHAYPFIRTPRVMNPSEANLIPGEESFNDISVEASTLIPVVGSWAATLTGELIQGKSFHPEENVTDGAWVAHLSNTFILDPASFDIGFSATQGKNSVEYDTKSTIIGADIKAKIILNPTVALTVAGEGVYKNAKIADSTELTSDDNRYGFYTFANLQFRTRFNGGVLFEMYQDPENRDNIDKAIKPFFGFSVLEESTLIRVSYEYFMNSDGGHNTAEIQLLFSMGPHKAHQF